MFKFQFYFIILRNFEIERKREKEKWESLLATE